VTYSVKETYFTLQGEGANTGRAAVFCRFAGCNLWTGRERDREAAVCRFCDTDFVGTDGPGGGRFDTAEALAGHARGMWPDAAGGAPLVVCTGGEPLLQLDGALIDAFHRAGMEVAVETNGTRAAPAGLDWVCVSPKAGAELVLRQGHELKLVFPQDQLMPGQLEELERRGELSFDHWYLQPMDGPERERNTRLAIAHCLAHPRWRLSLQTHKYLGIP
jgi:7-carboxy-7-deazaguanine synthase (Cx14CxxC type)